MSTNRKKQYEVLKRTTRDILGVKLDEKYKFKFGPQGQFVTEDAGVARDIQKHHKHEAVVMEVDKPKPFGDVSRSFFGNLPEMPWKVKKVIREKPNGKSKSQVKREMDADRGETSRRVYTESAISGQEHRRGNQKRAQAGVQGH